MAALQRWQKYQQQSLFDRIHSESNQNDYELNKTRLDSIKFNLLRILNSRPGGCQSAYPMGVVDLNDATMNSSEIKTEICREIKNCIEKYEPRIIQVTVIARANDSNLLTMQFAIQAIVKDEFGTDNIEFRVHFDDRQRYFFE
ncbi:MAG: type VI secretion system baseplate subunit TssE [Gilliamella sp.]|uniref:type VI secretion system baseplate subunit TssE n=1 Tax=Gilliamella sp. TaxID=1891236 RepID=UPI0025EAF8D0|nr:type VI secretion system baseplate subunit TssE [Gilliamella sp.]MCO6538096.1 type VI secretion system baseplate subunit TssE [Gilliamella sp.]MCO6540245.1 type VI secretion system baseplate subunit TssE [Gilliamella sp.]